MTVDYNDRTIEAYDASPDKYVDTTKQMVLLPELEMLVSLLPDRSAPVLDAGCAYGRDCALLAGMGVKTVGVDMSDKLLKRAKTLHPNLEFAKMDVRHLDFPNGKFAGVWCNAVLLHLKDNDIVVALKELHKVLKPNGAVCISFKEGEGSREVSETFTSDKSRFYNFKNLDAVAALLAQSSFKVASSYILNERERFGSDKRDINWVYCFATKSS